jgi:hypothetical protein
VRVRTRESEFSQTSDLALFTSSLLATAYTKIAPARCRRYQDAPEPWADLIENMLLGLLFGLLFGLHLLLLLGVFLLHLLGLLLVPLFCLLLLRFIRVLLR